MNITRLEQPLAFHFSTELDHEDDIAHQLSRVRSLRQYGLVIDTGFSFNIAAGKEAQAESVVDVAVSECDEPPGGLLVGLANALPFCLLFWATTVYVIKSLVL